MTISSYRLSRRSLLPACAALVAVARLAAAQKTIPTPESVFGFSVGADSQLIDYDQSIGYFRRLAQASNRIKLLQVGTTSFGHAWTAAVISSPENLAKLDQFRRINSQLAHPEGLTDSAAKRLAHDGRIIVDISGGLHASEIAGSQHTPQLAYELLSRANDPEIKPIFDNVIFFLWPSINPDGQDIVVNYCRALYGNQNPPPMELYQKYIGHDNNRDAYMLNVVESRVIRHTWNEWEPDIIYVQHQSSPEPTRIWIPPFADPPGLHAPPIPAREINTIGSYIAQELDAHEEPGAVHMLATFDAWYPGYIDYLPVYQNAPSWWTETQGGNCATPKDSIPLANFPTEYRDLRPTPLYVSPWDGKRWGLRDAVNYMVTASTATLKYAAKFKDELLYNRYQSGRDVIRKYRTNAPYVYIVPQTQRDPVAPVELLRRLAFLGLRIDQLNTSASYEGTTYPAGTWAIPMDQEFGELARELLEVQHYPDLPDARPYDAAGWTLPYQMGVNVVEGRSPLAPEFRAALSPVKGKAVAWGSSPDAPFTTSAEAAGIVPPSGEIAGSGSVILLDPAQNNSFRFIARAQTQGATVLLVPATNGRGARYAVSGVAPAAADAWAKELALRAQRTSDSSALAGPALNTRVGVYKAPGGNMDEGWTEWLLDTYGVKYERVTPADLQAGNLAARFDVILYASQNLGAGRGGGRGRGGGGRAGGGGGGRGGPPPSGNPQPADTSRGPADGGVAAIDEFVRGGGTVVFWAGGANSAINTLQLPVRNVVAGLQRTEYFTGISLMRAQIDTTHPVMAGMPDAADVVVNNNPPVFTTLDGFDGSIMAKYPSDTTPLRSGWLNGEQHMRGYAAALDVKHGDGHVLLFGFQPEWRGQPIGSFRVVFNALFFAREAAAAFKPTPGFWTAPSPIH